MYDSFINEWGNNTRQVTKFGGECVALIAEFEAENNLPIIWGDAHVWANNPIMLLAYNWTTNDPTDPNQLPGRGDIVVWPLPNEHIAFFDHQLPDHQFMSYGQNSGGHLAHFQPHSWANVAGWYSLKQAPAAPAPEPIPEPAPVAVLEPVPQPPAPYIPPAAPMPVKLADKIALLAFVPTYSNELDAANRNEAKAIGSFPPGEYYQFAVNEIGLLQIGLNNQSTTTVWINPKDNVAPVVVPVEVATPPVIDPLKASQTADWRSTFSWFYPSHRLRIYEVNLSGTVEDLSGQANFTMEITKGQRVGAAGPFNYPDANGPLHYRLKVSSDKDFKYWFAVPVSYNGNAVLKLPKDTWWTRFKKDPEKVLKSIFNEGESVWLDIKELKPFGRKEKK